MFTYVVSNEAWNPVKKIRRNIYMYTYIWMTLVSIFHKKKKTRSQIRLVGTQYLSDRFAIPFSGFGRSLTLPCRFYWLTFNATSRSIFRHKLELQTFREIAIAVKRPKAQTLLFLFTFCDLFWGLQKPVFPLLLFVLKLLSACFTNDKTKQKKNTAPYDLV